MPAATLERVQSVDGVEEASGSVSGDVNLLDREGEPILSSGPPTIAATTGPERFDPLTYVDGEQPSSDGQIAIDKGTAEREQRQTLWWYILVAAVLLLAAESILSNRLSRTARQDAALAAGRIDHA